MDRIDKKQLVDHFLSKYGAKSIKHRYLMEKVVDSLNQEQYQALKSKVVKKQSLPQLSQTIQVKEASMQQKQQKEEEDQVMKKSASNFLTRDRFFKRNMRMDETEKKTVYFVDKEDEDEWGALVKYDSELYKREQQQKKEMEQKQQRELKEELDRQVKQKQKRQQQHKEEEDKFYKEERQLFQKQGEELQEKNHKKLEDIRKLQQDIDQQVNIKDEINRQKLREDRQYKEYIRNYYASSYDQQQKEIEAKKNKEKEFLQREMKNAKENKLMKLEQGKKIKKQEQEEFNQYGEYLKEIENKRQKEKEEMNKQKYQLISRWDNILNVKEQEDERLKKEEDRFKFWKSIDDNRFYDSERHKQERRENLKVKTLKTLEKQIDEKKRQEESQKQYDILQGRQLRQTDEHFWQDQKLKKLKQQERYMKHSKQLQEQANEKRYKREVLNGRMTLDELLWNKELLKQIKEENVDDNIQSVNLGDI